MKRKSLAEVVAAHPYPDFASWWPMGKAFMTFMANAIVSQWQSTVNGKVESATVEEDVATYIQMVYQQTARATLVQNFIERQQLHQMKSGEFDALSYAFFKSAFEVLSVGEKREEQLRFACHAFTQQVGRLFYHQLHEHLALSLPQQLQNNSDLQQLESAIAQVGEFLKSEGYLRDHFAFRFDVTVATNHGQIVQTVADVTPALAKGEVAYALYEMGYPAILPSAVYLYQTMGEAQHHSSRTIEELFGRIDYIASETADFDPTGYPSDMVVELWEIRARETA